MELVIKITKKLYDRYKEKDHIKRCDIDEFEKALDRCIILPKGHGSLIDVDALLEKQYCIDDSVTLSIRDVVNVDDVEDAPTIIEADKGKKNDRKHNTDNE